MSGPEKPTRGGVSSGKGSQRARAGAARGSPGAARGSLVAVASGAPGNEVGELQRARILAGAIEAVAEHGYGGLTVSQVIARARISRRTFYELFADREECFLAAFEEALVQAQGPVLDAYARGRSWCERIGEGLDALLAFLEEQPMLGRLLVVDALAAGPEVLARRARVLGVLAGAVAEGGRESRRRRDPGPLVAEGVVGAVLAVLHARLREVPPAGWCSLSGLSGQLMGMIVLPYLGAAAAERELARPAPRAGGVRIAGRRLEANPLHGLNMRLTYRTLRVLCVVAELGGREPTAGRATGNHVTGSRVTDGQATGGRATGGRVTGGQAPSNREIADHAGIVDQGQTSKLLARLQGLGLIENAGGGRASGEPNAWTLTARGGEVVDAIRERPSPG
jgi:AcrR family transcriptional regulator